MHRRQTLQWCARFGLKALQRLQSRVPFRLVGLIIGSVSPFSPFAIASTSGFGSSNVMTSGGTTSGSIVMDLKRAVMARTGAHRLARK
jgi:hypothetical protein